MSTVHTLDTTCGNCQKRLRYKPEAAGRRVACPSCQEIVSLPPEEVDAAPEPPELPDFTEDHGEAWPIIPQLQEPEPPEIDEKGWFQNFWGERPWKKDDQPPEPQFRPRAYVILRTIVALTYGTMALTVLGWLSILVVVIGTFLMNEKEAFSSSLFALLFMTPSCLGVLIFGGIFAGVATVLMDIQENTQLTAWIAAKKD